MPKSLCSCETVAVTREDPNVVSIACAVHGRGYLFRTPSGGWETQEARQERMKTVCVCTICEDEYHEHEHTNPSHPKAGKLCPGCIKRLAVQRISGPRSNTRSPWRIGVQPIHPLRFFTCQCGRSVETRCKNKYQCDECQAETNKESVRQGAARARARKRARAV